MKNRKHVLAVAGVMFMGLLSPVTSFAADPTPSPTATASASAVADPNAFDVSQAVKKAKVIGCALKIKGNCSKKKFPKNFNFAEMVLTGMNFSGADLTGADFSDTTLDKVNFTGANLTGADLKGTNLKGTNLQGANLKGANLKGVIRIE